jgi:hypothetical protein
VLKTVLSSDIKPISKLIFVDLLCYSGGQSIFPGIRRISRDLNFKRNQTICDCVKELEQNGFIKVRRIKGRSNNYILATSEDLTVFKSVTSNNPEDTPSSDLLQTRKY